MYETFFVCLLLIISVKYDIKSLIFNTTLNFFLLIPN